MMDRRRLRVLLPLHIWQIAINSSLLCDRYWKISLSAVSCILEGPKNVPFLDGQHRTVWRVLQEPAIVPERISYTCFARTLELVFHQLSVVSKYGNVLQGCWLS